MSCSAEYYTGAFDSFDSSKNPYHNLRRCKFINSYAKNYYAHTCIEYSSEIRVDSNIYIHRRSSENGGAGTVVNWRLQGSTVYSNSLFVDGNAYKSGGLSFPSFQFYSSAEFFVKSCFFLDNYGTDNTAKEIYFDGNTSSNANKNRILHSFTATIDSKVYIQSNPSKDQDWLIEDYIEITRDIELNATGLYLHY